MQMFHGFKQACTLLRTTTIVIIGGVESRGPMITTQNTARSALNSVRSFTNWPFEIFCISFVIFDTLQMNTLPVARNQNRAARQGAPDMLAQRAARVKPIPGLERR
jgi:hypothetical protein